MVKVFLCDKCGPSKEAISHLQFKNSNDKEIIRLIRFNKDQLEIKFTSQHIKTDSEYIEEFICSSCGLSLSISFMPDFLFSVSKVVNNIIKE